MSEVPLYSTVWAPEAGLSSSSSLLLSSLELSDTQVLRLKYEPSSEPLHISAK